MPIVPSLAGQILDDVYILEVPSPPTIQGIQTGIVGLVGTFQQGIVGALYSISDYPTAVRMLGKSNAQVGGAIAIQNLLRQGAGALQVTPVFGTGSAAASVLLYDSQATPGLVGTLTAAQQHPQTGLMAALVGTGPNAWSASISTPTTPNGTFSLTISAGSVSETYNGLTPATWVATVNAASKIVTASAPATPSENVPADGSTMFTGGALGTLTAGAALDAALVGSVDGSGNATGLALLGTLAPATINIAMVAEYGSTTVNAALANLANTIDCVAVVCTSNGTVSQAQVAKGALSQSNVVFCDGWTYCYDADLASNRACAPTALVAGMASQLGPQFSWGNKQISGTIGLVTPRSRADMATLQQSGILCLADRIPAGGFGSRSGVATDGSEVYVRRMRYFLEYSIMGAMGWAVDALQSNSPNDPLRRNVTQAIGTYLNRLAHPVDAALKTIDSFSVTCNQTNNPPEQVAAGVLNVSVAVRLLAAAKQVIIACNISTSAVTTSSTVAA